MDLIDREQAIEVIRELCLHYTDTKSVYHPHIDFVIEELEKLPSAEKTGKWILVDEAEPRRYGCSCCKRLSYTMDNYCSYCGARMVTDESTDRSL